MDFKALRKQLPAHVANPDPEIYFTGEPIFLDFETTVIQKGSAHEPENDVVLSCWTFKGKKYHCWGGVYDQTFLMKHIDEADFIVAHNAKFELAWLARCGLDLTKAVVFCTQIAEYVLCSNSKRMVKLALDVIAQERVQARKIKLISYLYKNAKQCSRDIPESWLLRYCIRDVELTEKIFYQQREELKERGQLPIMYARCLLTPVLADIEGNGMQIDATLVEDKADALEREYAESEQVLEEFTGGINLNSPLQVAEFLYGELEFEEKRNRRGQPIRTVTGNKKADQETVLALKPKTPRQRTFLTQYKRHRQLYSELTKYLRKFRLCCKDDGGIMLGQFNQTTTKSQRLSSSGLKYSTQFQNFPRAYKPLFKARHDGWLVGEGDGAQLEFRVAGHLGRCGAVRKDLAHKVDVHSVTAKVIGVDRQSAKADTFKPLFGGKSGTPRQKKYYAYFREKYAGVTAAQQRWIDEVLVHKVLTTEWGMRYYFPNCEMKHDGFVTNSTNICNYPVQALATAEIIPAALVYFWHYTKLLKLLLLIVNTIHDSIIAELPPEEEKVFHELCRQCLIHEAGWFLKKMYDMDFTIPLGAGVKTGHHWSVGEEITYED